jgi:hypothetical protein
LQRAFYFFISVGQLAPFAGSAFTSFLFLCCRQRAANPRWSSYLIGMMIVI